MHKFQLKIAYELRAQRFLDFDQKENLKMRFAGFIGSRTEFFQKMMSVL